VGDVGAFRVADVHDLLFANGAGQLEPFFGEIQVERYPDALEITEVAALAAYVNSLGTAEDDIADVLAAAEAPIARDGSFHVTKSVGLFRCLKH
jgi:hypothetical protein